MNDVDNVLRGLPEPRCKNCRHFKQTKIDKGFCMKHELYDCSAYFHCQHYWRKEND